MDEVRWRNLYLPGDEEIRRQIKEFRLKAVEVNGSLFILSSHSRYDYILDDYDKRKGINHGVSRYASKHGEIQSRTKQTA